MIKKWQTMNRTQKKETLLEMIPKVKKAFVLIQDSNKEDVIRLHSESFLVKSTSKVINCDERDSNAIIKTAMDEILSAIESEANGLNFTTVPYPFNLVTYGKEYDNFNLKYNGLNFSVSVRYDETLLMLVVIIACYYKINGN